MTFPASKTFMFDLERRPATMARPSQSVLFDLDQPVSAARSFLRHFPGSTASSALPARARAESAIA